MNQRKILEKGLEEVEAEIKKAKAYFKRTKDYTVKITKDQYLDLLEFKKKMLKKILKETKKVK